MHRKILGLLTALVALGAFAAMPAIGSAATLTETTAGGVVHKVPAGAGIIGEGTGATKLTSPGFEALNIECNENVITGSVHRNSNSIIEGTITDAWFQGNYFAGDTHTPCRNNLGSKVFIRTNLTNDGTTVERQVTHKEGNPPIDLRTHWCVEGNAVNDNFNVNPRNCTGVNTAFRFSVHLPGLVCGFKRTTAIPGTFNTSNTHTNVAELTTAEEIEFVTDSTIKEHSGFCPAVGKLDNFSFPLYTDTNTTPTTGIHAVPIIKTDPLYISSP